MDPNRLSVIPFSIIKKIASLEGIPLAGVVDHENCDAEIRFYKWWIANKFNASMQWMEKNIELREHPLNIFPGAKSIIVFGFPYFSEKIRKSKPSISRYAQCSDYHIVIKEKLIKILSTLKQLYPEVEGKAFSDSAPLLEKVLAQKAGLGWIGKNTCLINKEYGSYFFLGELFLNINVQKPLLKAKNLCASCHRCITACPTGALREPGVLDSSKCISYLTIENKEVIPIDFKNKLNGWIFGCDICQQVCPFNKKLKTNNIDTLAPMKKVINLKVKDILKMSGKEFQKQFKDTSLTRTAHKGIIRNIIAIKSEVSDVDEQIELVRKKYPLADMQYKLFYE